MEARSRINRKAGTTPVLIKIAPDLTLSELDDVVGAARRHRVDGMVIGNTTVLRPAWLRDRETAHERVRSVRAGAGERVLPPAAAQHLPGDE